MLTLMIPDSICATTKIRTSICSHTKMAASCSAISVTEWSCASPISNVQSVTYRIGRCSLYTGFGELGGTSPQSIPRSTHPGPFSRLFSEKKVNQMTMKTWLQIARWRSCHDTIDRQSVMRFNIFHLSLGVIYHLRSHWKREKTFDCWIYHRVSIQRTPVYRTQRCNPTQLFVQVKAKFMEQNLDHVTIYPVLCPSPVHDFHFKDNGKKKAKQLSWNQRSCVRFKSWWDIQFA